MRLFEGKINAANHRSHFNLDRERSSFTNQSAPPCATLGHHQKTLSSHTCSADEIRLPAGWLSREISLVSVSRLKEEVYERGTSFNSAFISAWPSKPVYRNKVARSRRFEKINVIPLIFSVLYHIATEDLRVSQAFAKHSCLSHNHVQWCLVVKHVAREISVLSRTDQ